MKRICYQLLSDHKYRGLTFKARCIQPWGEEHDHSDKTAKEACEAGLAMDCNKFHDFVASCGYGSPTDEGYQRGAEMIAEGRSYSYAAQEVAYLGLVE